MKHEMLSRIAKTQRILERKIYKKGTRPVLPLRRADNAIYIPCLYAASQTKLFNILRNGNSQQTGCSLPCGLDTAQHILLLPILQGSLRKSSSITSQVGVGVSNDVNSSS